MITWIKIHWKSSGGGKEQGVGWLHRGDTEGCAGGLRGRRAGGMQGRDAQWGCRDVGMHSGAVGLPSRPGPGCLVGGSGGGHWQWCGWADPWVEGQGSVLRPLFRFKCSPGGFVLGSGFTESRVKGSGRSGGFHVPGAGRRGHRQRPGPGIPPSPPHPQPRCPPSSAARNGAAEPHCFTHKPAAAP